MAKNNNNEVKITFKAFNQDFNKSMKEMNQETSALKQEMKLQEVQMKHTATETEKLEASVNGLQKAYEISQRKTQATAEALVKVKEVWGENSEEAAKYEKQLRSMQIAEQQAANALTETKQALESTKQAYAQQEQSLKQLNNFLKITDKTLDDFADTLGTDLVNAIREGRVDSKQLEDALGKIGKEALGTNADLDKMKKALKNLDSGSSLKEVQKDLKGIAKEAKDAEKDVGSLSDTLGGIAGGLVAGGGIAGAVSQALDMASLETKINVTFDVPEESKAAVLDAVKSIEAYGVDAEAALEGVRRQWALNSNASDEANQKIVEGAGVIARAYSGIDFTELIQETNEIAGELNISNEEALALTNSLLKIGFPPEQLDIIAEYGMQLIDAGYNAQEIQALMSAGVETGTWNIDNLLDGLKEGRILIGEFGVEVDDTMADMLKGTGISAKQLQDWGKAVSNGGEEGSKAMQEVAKALDNIKDGTKKNEIGIKLFGTKWEDQGSNITDTILNMDKHLKTAKENTDGLSDSVEQINADPAVKLQKAMSDLQIALAPLLGVVADVVGGIASWMSANPQLAATITAIVTVLGILVGLVTAIAPIISTIALTTLPAFSTAFAAVAAPIGIAIAAITAIIAIVALIVSNWEPISQFFTDLWTGIQEIFTSVVTAISDFLSSTWESISTTMTDSWNAITDFFVAFWEGITTIFTETIEGIISFITNSWNAITSTTTSVWNGLKSTISGIWEGIKNTASSMWEGIKNFIMTPVNAIKDGAVNAFNTMKDKIVGVFDGLKTAVKAPINGVISLVNSFIDGLNKLQVPDWVPGVGGFGINIPRIPMLYKGTNFFKGTPEYGNLALVGEKGPELVNLPIGSRVHTADETQQMFNNSGGDITLNTSVQVDGREIAKATAKYNDRELFNRQNGKNRGGGRK